MSNLSSFSFSDTKGNELYYFWIAFYKDGTYLPQFDFETGEQHLFKEIDQSKLDKFGWFPVTEELCKKIKDPRYKPNPKLPYYVLKLREGQRLIALRREFQKFYTYSYCQECGFSWQWMPNQPDWSIGDSGLPRFGSRAYYYSEKLGEKEVFGLICPKCGVKDLLKCPTCNEWWNKVNNEGLYQCPKCGRNYVKPIIQKSEHKIENIYLLGWQETVEGRNRKMIMFISQDGTFEISDDFNFK